jgi:hypothetical protein
MFVRFPSIPLGIFFIWKLIHYLQSSDGKMAQYLRLYADGVAKSNIPKKN